MSASSSNTALTSFLVRPVVSLIWLTIWVLFIGSVMVLTLRAAVALVALAAVFFFAAMDYLPLVLCLPENVCLRRSAGNRSCFPVRYAPGLRKLRGPLNWFASVICHEFSLHKPSNHYFLRTFNKKGADVACLAGNRPPAWLAGGGIAILWRLFQRPGDWHCRQMRLAPGSALRNTSGS